MATPGANRSLLPSGPDFFSGGLPEELDDDEYDDALRAAAGVFARESGRFIQLRKYPHLAVQGMLTSVRLLELLDARKMGHLDEVFRARVLEHQADERREARRAQRDEQREQKAKAENVVDLQSRSAQ